MSPTVPTPTSWLPHVKCGHYTFSTREIITPAESIVAAAETRLTLSERRHVCLVGLHVHALRREGRLWCVVNGISIDSAPFLFPQRSRSLISFPLQFAKTVRTPTPDVWLHFLKLQPPPHPVSPPLCMFVISEQFLIFTAFVSAPLAHSPSFHHYYFLIKPAFTVNSVFDSSARQKAPVSSVRSTYVTCRQSPAQAISGLCE